MGLFFTSPISWNLYKYQCNVTCEKGRDTRNERRGEDFVLEL